ncbi:transmembrane protein 186-like isoform X2 [Bombus pyrosoma]|uniref:transmembrane protein 186-like isoform X2 n=1 Tax=Bombus pyrosoma TaxID=396416 RepID=UPI001CB91859|nr:transmembrane protein 186-like isoform X2 [Bombus pyrosoma]
MLKEMNKRVSLKCVRKTACLEQQLDISESKYKNLYNFVHSSEQSGLRFTGALVPVTVSLQMLDFMSTVENLSFTACNCLLVLMLHTIGHTCNNLVGTIYIKDKDDLENQNVIISYINYWGKRIDLRTTVDDIIPFTENYMNTSNSLYKILSMKSCKQKLKVYTKYGKITEEASFSNIFG